jgi:enoyl-CoA hydratase/carnithine racemase
VIGIGPADHPLAPGLDAVIEPDADWTGLVRGVLSHPRAAATLVQVLRVTHHLTPHEALDVESMAYAMLQASAEHRDWQSVRATRLAPPAGRVLMAREGDRLELTLDRAGAGNAIDCAMRDALFDALSLAAVDPQVVQVHLRARGKAFSLGADLDEFGTTTDAATAHAIRAVTLPARAALACAGRLHVHVDGACVGAGLELAAFAGRVTATPRSWFQLPELAMGIIPGAGGCVSLPRRIGRQRAALMVLSGRRIGARQALAWGLVDALVDDAAGDDGSGHIGG